MKSKIVIVIFVVVIALLIQAIYLFSLTYYAPVDKKKEADRKLQALIAYSPKSMVTRSQSAQNVLVTDVTCSSVTIQWENPFSASKASCYIVSVDQAFSTAHCFM